VNVTDDEVDGGDGAPLGLSTRQIQGRIGCFERRYATWRKPLSEVHRDGARDSVLRSHRTRTVQNSAAYLLPELRAGLRLFDVGSGPA
jgi:hypothetical protein